MASKTKLNGLNGAHTAGIFSDMTVDGPEIGTLVLIVDRAKNLPNRKTIGKQDPYCAARLGKEAKKTDTDRRGGQTPRWDQELRYTVHDSPDYYQLKVSVFNDDKKTDLIGETWVDLKDVVVPGGGQNDLWHNLSCKGKYAGEIRIEITYYDSRPKQEKPEKVRQAATNGIDDGSRDSLKGPRQPKAAVKRRPLPSDPVTGAPASPVAVPDHVQNPPRGYPPSPTAAPDHIQMPPRGYQNTPGGIPDHVQTPPRGYQTPPTAIPEHVQTPQRGYQSPSYIPNHSPLQTMEYATAPANYSPSHGYDDGSNSSMNGYGQSPGNFTTTSPSQPPQIDRYEMHDPASRSDYSHSNSADHYRGDDAHSDPRDMYNPRQQQSPYELPQPDEFGSPPSPGGPPPPPPAHRTRAGSSHVSPHPLESQGSYGFSQDNRSPNPYGTPTHEGHRHSVPSQSQSNSYQAYSPDKTQEQFRRSANGGYQQSPPRHQSYDSRYNGDYGSMQPTVEDAPPSPGGSYSGLRNGSRVSQHDERRYDQVPSPAPLNLSGRGSSASGRNSMSNAPTPTHQYTNSSGGYANNSSQNSFRDRSQPDMLVSSRTSYNSMQQQDHHRRQSEDPMGGTSNYQRPRGQSEDQIGMSNYSLPPVPATLVPGMDPMIAQEISERIYDEKRASYNQGAGNSARGRYQNSPQYQQNKPKLLSYQENDAAFVPAAATYDDRQGRFSTATVPVVKPRAISPDPRPMRKSVSPSPRPSDDTRRLSGIPFGPDSYNALNPSLTGPTSTPSLSAAYDTKVIDPDAKIITHDGREIDPSDHIPESNYAPLLESKGPKYASQLPDRNYRPPPSVPQPVSATGRRPLRQAGRPQSMATSSPIYMNKTPPQDPITPTGRNRLQKKANRMSAHPAQGSSPLAPITPYQDNSYAQRSLPRSHSTDFHSNENYAPSYGGSPGYRGTAGPPPIPAKVPMGMNGPPPPQPSGGDAWALLEEMKSIDLGHGRARRRGY